MNGIILGLGQRHGGRDVELIQRRQVTHKEQVEAVQADAGVVAQMRAPLVAMMLAGLTDQIAGQFGGGGAIAGRDGTVESRVINHFTGNQRHTKLESGIGL